MKNYKHGVKCCYCCKHAVTTYSKGDIQCGFGVDDKDKYEYTTNEIPRVSYIGICDNWEEDEWVYAQ